MDILPQLTDYAFVLPPELIAQEPPLKRGGSRLMLLDRRQDLLAKHNFGDLPKLLPDKALLIFNQVRVTPCRLWGNRIGGSGEGKPVEFFILEPPEAKSPKGAYDLWCLVRPGRKVKPPFEFLIERPDNPEKLTAEILEIDPESGRRLVRFHFNDEPEAVLGRVGHLPLPAYIKRSANVDDEERYQTVYAQESGAVAAPTAGLHFTPEMLTTLTSMGIETAFITLKVGAGTFMPLTAEQLTSGRLHQEHITVPQDTVAAVGLAKKEGRPVIAVGTTTVRSLEWAAREGELREYSGRGDLFIRPGYRFKVVDGLLTNFHLPGSSLLMLVAALAGREKIMAAYNEAVKARFRFYSYGDAMLIL